MKIPKYRIFILVAFLGASLFFVIEMGFLRAKAPRMPMAKGFDLYDTLIQLLRNDYLEERDPVRTTDGALRGLVNSLDPVSAYLDEETAAKRRGLKGPVMETGLLIYKKYGSFPVVIGTVEGSPAAGSQIKPGDAITAIEGRNSLVMSLEEARLRLESADASPVKLKILRGGDTFEVKLARAPGSAPDFDFTSQPGRPAYLKIRRFTPSLAADIETLLKSALDKGRDKLIIDLRTASGAGYDQALGLVNLFIKDRTIGNFIKKDGTKKPLTCSGKAPLAFVKAAVWTGPATMGAAEMAAGALQEIKKYRVIGLETLGMAAETAEFPLENGALVILVVDSFSLPSGHSLWGTGVKPDFKVKPDENTDKAYWDKTMPAFSKTN